MLKPKIFIDHKHLIIMLHLYKIQVFLIEKLLSELTPQKENWSSVKSYSNAWTYCIIIILALNTLGKLKESIKSRMNLNY